MGTLVGIARREKKRAPMETMEHAEISTATGGAEDFRYGSLHGGLAGRLR